MLFFIAELPIAGSVSASCLLNTCLISALAVIAADTHTVSPVVTGALVVKGHESDLSQDTVLGEHAPLEDLKITLAMGDVTDSAVLSGSLGRCSPKSPGSC